jgi:RNA polymerase primary sigma factor
VALSRRQGPTIHPLLRMAARTGVAAVVESRLEHGDAPDARDDRGQTALMLAAQGGHAAVCRVLLARGADASARDRDGRDALALAVAGNHTDVIAILTSQHRQPVTVVVDQPDEPPSADDDGFDFSGWEAEPEVVAPKHDPSVEAAASALQASIARHVPIDRDEPWDDVALSMPRIRKKHPRRRVHDLSAEACNAIHALLLEGIEHGIVSRRRVEDLAEWMGEEGTERDPKVEPDFDAPGDHEALMRHLLLEAFERLDVRVEDFEPWLDALDATPSGMAEHLAEEALEAIREQRQSHLSGPAGLYAYMNTQLIDQPQEKALAQAMEAAQRAVIDALLQSPELADRLATFSGGLRPGLAKLAEPLVSLLASKQSPTPEEWASVAAARPVVTAFVVSLGRPTSETEHLDELVGHFRHLGIRVIDRDEPNRRRPSASSSSSSGEAGGNGTSSTQAARKETPSAPPGAASDEVEGAYGRTNDPVRVYLRKMGSVSLLTREGEVEIAKRIEEGQFKVRAAVLSSPVSVQIALDLLQRIELKTLRVNEALIEPREGEEVTEPPAERLNRCGGEVRRLERERRKLEERLAGVQPMRKPYRKQLATRVKNVRQQIQELLVEIAFQKRIIDRMAARIKLLQFRLTAAEETITSILGRLGATSLQALRSDVRVLRTSTDSGEIERIVARYRIKDRIYLINQDRTLAHAERKLRRVEMEAGCPAEELKALTRLIMKHERAAERAKTAALVEAARQWHEAWHQLVVANLRLVAFKVRKLWKADVPVDDLVQEGCFGLMRAAEMFDHTRGLTFGTYALNWIVSPSRRMIAEDGLIRLPSHIGVARNKVLRAWRQLGEPDVARMGAAEKDFRDLDSASLDAVAEATGVERATAGYILRSVLGVIAPDEGMPEAMALPCESIPPADEVRWLGELREALESGLAQLQPRNAEVIRRRFGLHDGVEETLEEAGAAVGLTRERVRQIQARVLEKLAFDKRLRQFLEFRPSGSNGDLPESLARPGPLGRSDGIADVAGCTRRAAGADDRRGYAARTGHRHPPATTPEASTRSITETPAKETASAEAAPKVRPYEVAMGEYMIAMRDTALRMRMALVLTTHSQRTYKEIHRRFPQLRRIIHSLSADRPEESMVGAAGRDRFLSELKEGFANVIRTGPLERMEITTWSRQGPARPRRGGQEEASLSGQGRAEPRQRVAPAALPPPLPLPEVLTLDTRIDAFDLSMRAYRACDALGITTAADLLKLTRNDLRGMSNCGRKTIDEITGLRARVAKRLEKIRPPVFGPPRSEEPPL